MLIAWFDGGVQEQVYDLLGPAFDVKDANKKGSSSFARSTATANLAGLKCVALQKSNRSFIKSKK
jgi:hypothetical protein